MDITDAGCAFVEVCVVSIDCEAGATGEMVCAIVYIEHEERQTTTLRPSARRTDSHITS